jgi:hypothetical protein
VKFTAWPEKDGLMDERNESVVLISALDVDDDDSAPERTAAKQMSTSARAPSTILPSNESDGHNARPQTLPTAKRLWLVEKTSWWWLRDT